MHKKKQAEISREQVDQGRRTAIRKIAAGTVALAGCSMLPEKWSTPLVEFGSLPAHATTSGIEELIELIEERAATESVAEETAASEQVASENKENSDLRGFSNKLTMQDSGERMSCDSIWQHKIVFPKLGPEYGKSLLLVWSDGNELSVPDARRMVMNGDENDFRKYQPGGGYSGNNPDIPTMEVYAKRGTHPSSVTLYY